MNDLGVDDVHHQLQPQVRLSQPKPNQAISAVAANVKKAEAIDISPEALSLARDSRDNPTLSAVPSSEDIPLEKTNQPIAAQVHTAISTVTGRSLPTDLETSPEKKTRLV